MIYDNITQDPMEILTLITASILSKWSSKGKMSRSTRHEWSISILKSIVIILSVCSLTGYDVNWTLMVDTKIPYRRHFLQSLVKTRGVLPLNH